MGRKRTPGLLLRGGIWHIDKVVFGQRIVESTRSGNLAEAESVHRAIMFAKATGCSIYFVHISTRDALEEIRRSKIEYPGIFLETCPQYLTLTKNSPVGNLGKVNPPLRSTDDVEALWRGISEGVVDTIGTDHCANLKETKKGDIWSAKTGFPGSATMLPIL